MYCFIPFWLFETSAFVKEYIWSDPSAIGFMFGVYHVELLTDLLLTYKARKLTGRVAWNKTSKVLFSCTGAAVLLFVATGAAKFSPGFRWLPDTTFFIILAGLILIILARGSKLGILNPLVAEVLSDRITNLINSQKKEQKNDLDAIANSEPTPVTGLAEGIKN